MTFIHFIHSFAELPCGDRLLRYFQDFLLIYLLTTRIISSNLLRKGMDSEESRDGSGDANSSSSSSSSSSPSHSSSSHKSDAAKNKAPKSPPQSSPASPPRGPRSPTNSAPRSPSPEMQSSPPKPPQSPGNLSEAHSDINSPENSMTASPVCQPTSPEGPQSPNDIRSPDSLQGKNRNGPKSPQSPRSAPASPDMASQPQSPNTRSQPASPESTPASPKPRSRPASPSPERNHNADRNTWGGNEQWRRRNKAEQKQEPQPRSRSGSISSQSSRSSSYNKRSSIKDPATEEISEGEMESDQDDKNSVTKSTNNQRGAKDDAPLNISHDDLSDVSDLDSVGGDDDKHDKPGSPKSPIKTETKINGKRDITPSPKKEVPKIDTPKLDKVPQEKTSNTEDGEEQLDFEAEEGECLEPKPVEQPDDGEIMSPGQEECKAPARARESSPEEGEVSDEAERRPEETEPRPVCRFFSRGACTWGISCRFLHPGVTDKGNYSMFDVVRNVPAHAPPGYVPPAGAHATPPESAWERGLRTAKEMLRIANKRKEQDMDFEEKKLHLSAGAAHDPDAELAYAAAAVGASPPPAREPAYREPDVYPRPYGPPGAMFRPRFLPGRPPMMDERERYYERERYERERPERFERPERYERVERVERYERAAPPFYDEAAAEAEDPYHKQRRVRASREVIVQRSEAERRERGERGERGGEREGARGERGERGAGPRGEEWADPWMRGEPSARRRKPPSSADSYSSTSSSRSSSRSSRSPGARRKRQDTLSSRQRLSPSVIVRERRQASARATAMNPPAPRRRAPSPAAARQHDANPPAPHPAARKSEVDPYGRDKPRNKKRYSRSSSSGSESSSSSSGSESESRSSSSSGSSSDHARRGRRARLLNAAATTSRLNSKSAAGLAAAVSTHVNKKEPVEKEVKKRPASPLSNAPPPKKPTSRREELLKQLKAVEDAIARKRSKI